MSSFFNTRFHIGEHGVGESFPTFIIAEAGVAHFGVLEKAFQLVDLAASSGADAVKFQIFNSEAMISGASNEWRERMRSRELPYEDFIKIKEHCAHRGIPFFATAHDEPSLDFLASLNPPVFKIGSGELANWPFLEKIGALEKPVILSTGMYSLEDVEQALEVFKNVGNRDIALLHCVTSYPVPPNEVNLTAMTTIKKTFETVTGYSDHTKGHHFPLAAVALGAKIIEKHITLDYDVPNAQDWKVSCGASDLPIMIEQIREIEAGLGTGRKEVGDAERHNLEWARKSVVAARDISANEIISREHLAFKRPGSGIPPSELPRILGRRAKTSIKLDAIILEEHLA